MSLLFAPGQVVELRALGTTKGTISGYFDDLKALKAAADSLSGTCPGVYATLNPVEPALLARAKNRLQERAKSTTGDPDILNRRWLLVDLDPCRPAGISSTDGEHEAALTLARQVREWLTAQGWPEPILEDSGNGAYLLYRVDLPNDADSLALVGGCLKALSFRFDSEAVKVDTGTGNAGRLIRLPGTLNCKGDNTPDRPHRMARILEKPAHYEPVSIELLHALAAQLPVVPQPAPRDGRVPQRGEEFDLDRWIDEHHLPVLRSGPWQNGGRRWILDCPNNPEHTGSCAYIVQLPSGAIAAGCHHNSCQDFNWHALRALYEPQRARSSSGGENGRHVLATRPGGSGEGNQSENGQGAGKDSAPLPWTPFPVEALPEPYASYVRDSARARQCDPAAVAIPQLAALAGAIGTARTVRIGTDWYTPAVLWTAIVAPSGAVKTPAFRAALAPLEEIDRQAREQWRGEHDAYQANRMSYEVDLAEWKRRKRADRGVPPEAPVEPPLPRCIVEDATLQALATVLAQNLRGVLLARDELSGWVRSFDQFTGSTGADLARWLEIYRAGPLRVDRAGTGHLYVPRAAVSVCGTIQTDILPGVFTQEHQAAGLLARFLLAAPPEPPRQWNAIRQAQAPEVAKLVTQFTALRALDLPAEGEQPRALGLNPESADLYGEWFTAHEIRRRNTEAGPWRAALAKLEELPGRLALVLALARSEKPVDVDAVDADTMRHAITLTDWFRAEGERVYSLLVETPEARGDRELMEWVGRHQEGVTARQVVQGQRRYRGEGGVERAEADLRRLVNRSLLGTEERQGTRGPAVTVYSAVSSDAPPGSMAPPSTSTGFLESLSKNSKPVDVDTVATPTGTRDDGGKRACHWEVEI